jgi:hypothetical protein
VSTEDLAAFVDATLDDPPVRSELLPLRGAAFADRLVTLAAERGVTVSGADVDEALRQARRTWWERWV